MAAPPARGRGSVRRLRSRPVPRNKLSGARRRHQSMDGGVPVRESPRGGGLSPSGACAASPEISVVFPVRNEKDNLRPLVAEITAALEPLEVPFELIGIDDGSTDG